MAEPTSTAASSGVGLAATMVAVLGPVAGEYAAIVFAALAGALWPLSARSGLGRADGAWLLLRLVGTSVVLTGILAWAAHRYAGVPVITALAPVSFGIAALGDRWRAVWSRIAGRVLRTVDGGRP